MITGSHNRYVKEIIALNKKRSARDSSGLFAAEGLKLFEEAPRELIERVFVSESFGANGAGSPGDVPLEVVSDSAFSKMCDTKTPQGILTVMRKPVYKEEQLLGGAAPFIIVLEELQDPGNVGTIIRTAEGAGATGVILTPGCADIFSPKTIRSTMGSVFRMPFIYAGDPGEIFGFLKSANIHSYAAHLKGTVDYTAPSYEGGTALFKGNESRGLSEAFASKCDTLVKIPMEGRLESLNAGIAAAILMYEVHSKRK